MCTIFIYLTVYNHVHTCINMKYYNLDISYPRGSDGCMALTFCNQQLRVNKNGLSFYMALLKYISVSSNSANDLITLIRALLLCE